MSQAHAMQAAAYMQAMTQMQIAAAASRQGYNQSWNSYNPYLNHYMGAYGSGFGLDAYSLQQQAAAANLSEAMQAKIGALNQARSFAAKAAAAKLAAKSAPKAKAQAKSVSPKTVPKAPKAPSVAPAVAGLLPKTSAPSSPQLAPSTPPLGAAPAPAAAPVAGKKGDEEDEAGCSQS